MSRLAQAFNCAIGDRFPLIEKDTPSINPLLNIRLPSDGKLEVLLMACCRI